MEITTTYCNHESVHLHYVQLCTWLYRISKYIHIITICCKQLLLQYNTFHNPGIRTSLYALTLMLGSIANYKIVINSFELKMLRI